MFRLFRLPQTLASIPKRGYSSAFSMPVIQTAKSAFQLTQNSYIEKARQAYETMGKSGASFQEKDAATVLISRLQKCHTEVHLEKTISHAKGLLDEWSPPSPVASTEEAYTRARLGKTF